MDLSVLWLLSSAVAFIGTVIAREMYMWFRNLIPKSVQCWFCLHKTEVPYTLSNSWHCPKCEQYNGFAEDGDYNKPIEQQFTEELNFSVSALGRCKNSWRKRERSLCANCNRNQELKVEQLAKFVPLNERNYDSEVEHFRAQIEKAYKLCPVCDVLLHSVLNKEREEYCVPRRLNASLVSKDQRGTWIVILNIFLGLSLSLIGFIQTRGATLLKKELKTLAFPLLKKHVPAAYSTLSQISPSDIKAAAVISSDYVVLIGTMLSLIAYYRTQRKPVLLLFTSLTWLIFLLVSLYNENGVEWFPFCQMFLGAISCILSFVVLDDIYSSVRDHQHKQQTLLQPKVAKSFSYSPKHVPNGTSTPRGTPPSPSSFVEATFNSAKTSASTSIRAPSIGGRDVGLEPRIRGLTLGTPPSRTREDDVQSVWGGCPPSIVNSTAYLPNSSSWTLYSCSPNLTTQSAPTTLSPPGVVHAPLSHVYTANSLYGNYSRPTSPAPSISSLFASNVNTNLRESNVRQRHAFSAIVSPPRLVLDSNSSSGVSTLADSDRSTRHCQKPLLSSRTTLYGNCSLPTDNSCCSLQQCYNGTSSHGAWHPPPPAVPNPQTNCPLILTVGFLSMLLCNAIVICLAYRNSLVSFYNPVYN